MSQEQNVGPRGAWVMAGVFFIAGALLLALAVGLIGQSLPSRSTPRWVIAAAGALFGAGGFVPLAATGQVSPRTGQLTGLLMVIALAALFNWVAFGPGTREFSGGASVMGVPIGAVDHSERRGRIVFGCFAALLDLIIVLGLRRLLAGAGRWRATSAPGRGTQDRAR